MCLRCGHCKKLAPEYEAAATRLKGIVPLAKVLFDLFLLLFFPLTSAVLPHGAIFLFIFNFFFLGWLHSPWQNLQQVWCQRLPHLKDLQRGRGIRSLWWSKKCRYVMPEFMDVFNSFVHKFSAFSFTDLLTDYVSIFVSSQMALSASLKSRLAHRLWSLSQKKTWRNSLLTRMQELLVSWYVDICTCLNLY